MSAQIVERHCNGKPATIEYFDEDYGLGVIHRDEFNDAGRLVSGYSVYNFKGKTRYSGNRYSFKDGRLVTEYHTFVSGE